MRLTRVCVLVVTAAVLTSSFLPLAGAFASPLRFAALPVRRDSSGCGRPRRASISANMPSQSAPEPRIELFFKTDAELRERVRMLAEHGFGAFSLVNKNNDDKLVEWVDTVLQEAPTASSVCAHYSLKYNKDKGGADATFRRFSTHLQKMERLGHGPRAEVLLISGSGPKTPLDAVACLEKLAREREEAGGGGGGGPSLGVAFNPYFEDAAQAAAERERLQVGR